MLWKQNRLKLSAKGIENRKSYFFCSLQNFAFSMALFSAFSKIYYTQGQKPDDDHDLDEEIKLNAGE